MIVLCGRSCSGKDTIKKELIKMGYKDVVTYTTRKPRENEVDGVSYHFIPQKDFLKKKEEGFFAETASYIIATGEIVYYGSAIHDLTEDKVIILNLEGVTAIKQIQSLNPIVICIDVGDKVIKERAMLRGDEPSEAKRRFEADKRDFANIDVLVDYYVDGRNSPRDNSQLIDFIVRHDSKERYYAE